MIDRFSMNFGFIEKRNDCKRAVLRTAHPPERSDSLFSLKSDGCLEQGFWKGILVNPELSSSTETCQHSLMTQVTDE
ncbi:MAG: hypothetical protein ACYYK0_07400 [Candidatus Eutrophobiaceae bacterium]